MIGLGLALAQPHKRVAVITGDGEMLMGLGALATIGIKRPPNLAVIVFDNGVYGETGMQPSHTQAASILSASRAACGIRDSASTSRDEAGLADLAGAAERPSRDTCSPAFVIAADEPPRVLPERDGVALKQPVPRRARPEAVRPQASAGVLDSAESSLYNAALC